MQVVDNDRDKSEETKCLMSVQNHVHGIPGYSKLPDVSVLPLPHTLFFQNGREKATTAPIAPPTEPPTLAVREKEPKRQEKRDRQGETRGTFCCRRLKRLSLATRTFIQFFSFFRILVPAAFLVALLRVLLQYKPPPYPVVSPLSSFSLRAFLQNHEKHNAFVSFSTDRIGETNDAAATDAAGLTHPRAEGGDSGTSRRSHAGARSLGEGTRVESTRCMKRRTISKCMLRTMAVGSRYVFP